jgi:hypothetical protein
MNSQRNIIFIMHIKFYIYNQKVQKNDVKTKILKKIHYKRGI